jgi:hypothetical protein
MMALLVCIAAPSPEGGGVGGRAGGRATGTAGPGSNEFGLARLGAAGPDRAQWSRPQAEATRNERHRKSDERQHSGEAEKTKMAKLETTSADNTIAQRKEDNGSGNIGAGASSDDSSNGGASSAGRGKEIGGGGKREGGGSDLSLVGAARNWLPTLP